jgi:hypothetical protein
VLVCLSPFVLRPSLTRLACSSDLCGTLLTVLKRFVPGVSVCLCRLPYHLLGRNKWEALGLEYPLDGVQTPPLDNVSTKHAKAVSSGCLTYQSRQWSCIPASTRAAAAPMWDVLLCLSSRRPTHVDTGTTQPWQANIPSFLLVFGPCCLDVLSSMQSLILGCFSLPLIAGAGSGGAPGGCRPERHL